MKYYLTQLFSTDLDPEDVDFAQTRIYYDISFQQNGDWKIESLYRANFRDDTCGDLRSYDWEFDYIFENSSRNIYLMIKSHDDWDFSNKHPIFYSGTNPEQLDLFLLDEWMLIRGVNGIIEKTLELNGTKEIEIDENGYNCFEYVINETLNTYTK